MTDNNTTLPNVIDVMVESFQQDVMETSATTLVVVDFWATWCQPCQTLLPLMHKLAQDYGGSFILAKVDIDQNQQLAQAFGVRSVPTVKFVKNGQIVDEFMGVLPENEIRSKIDAHVTRESDQAFMDAFELYKQGAENQELRQQAIQNMIQVCNSDTDNVPIRIQLARILIHESEFSDAKAILDALPEPFASKDDIKNLLLQIEMAEKTKDLPDLETLLQKINDNPDDHAARLQLSTVFTVMGEYERALDALFEIIRRDRSYEDDIGRKEMLKLFDVLSATGESGQALVSQYRRKLAQYLN